MLASFKLPLFLVAVLLSLVFYSNGSPAGFFGPSNFDECILESMKGVTNNAAAKAIYHACRSKFPIKKPDISKTRELSPAEYRLLTGRAGHSYGNVFKGNIYNGNKNITIYQITFYVTTKIDGKKITRNYIDEVSIPPLSTGEIDFRIVIGDKGEDYS